MDKVALKQGWGYKAGRMNKGFKRRFFVLRRKGVVKYYATEPSAKSKTTKSKGEIQITINTKIHHAEDTATIADSVDSPSYPEQVVVSHRLAIQNKDRTFFLHFATPGECHGWKTSLNMFIEALRDTVGGTGAADEDDEVAVVSSRPISRQSTKAASQTQSEASKSNHRSVIVIGGGIAGLSAAWHLNECHNITDVLVLEAGATHGGRVATTRLSTLPGVPLDAGASWIQGLKGNPLASIVQLAALETVPSTRGARKASLAVFNGSETVEAHIIRSAEAVYADTMEMVEERVEGMMTKHLDRGEPMAKDKSMARSFASSLTKNADFASLEETGKKLLGYLRSREEHSNSSPFAKLSTNFYFEDQDPPGQQFVARSMATIADFMAAPTMVRYNQQATRVEFGLHKVNASSQRAALFSHIEAVDEDPEDPEQGDCDTIEEGDCVDQCADGMDEVRDEGSTITGQDVAVGSNVNLGVDLDGSAEELPGAIAEAEEEATTESEELEDEVRDAGREKGESQERDQEEGEPQVLEALHDAPANGDEGQGAHEEGECVVTAGRDTDEQVAEESVGSDCDCDCDTTEQDTDESAIVSAEVAHQDAREAHTSQTSGRPAHCTVQTAAGDEFHCDYLVVATPLSVLRDGDIEFSPPLPREKVQAAQRLGFGTVNKVFLHFNRAFWDDPEITPADGIDKEFITNIAAFSDPTVTKTLMPATPLHFINYNKLFQLPVLVAVFYGTHAEYLENKSDSELGDLLDDQLRTMYPSASEDDLELLSISATRWGKSPFIRGSYATQALGMERHDITMLASSTNPLDDGTPRLFFAGEATEGDYFGTMHGAFLSGERVADELIASMRNTTTNTAKALTKRILSKRIKLTTSSSLV
eukprot:m.19734 g.19734  ORF g.19734 m.19734 type:complete len:877 (-) comp8071_c1_seq1:256-2886(-)